MKSNIRKTVALKRLKAKENFKNLTGLALENSFKDALTLRKKEDEEWKKFMFYSKLSEALDYINDRSDRNE